MATEWDYPAAHGRPVTTLHAIQCATDGHKTHTINGKDTGICPVCGEVK